MVDDLACSWVSSSEAGSGGVPREMEGEEPCRGAPVAPPVREAWDWSWAFWRWRAAISLFLCVGRTGSATQGVQ